MTSLNAVTEYSDLGGSSPAREGNWVSVRLFCCVERFERSSLLRKRVERPRLKARWPALVLICLLMVGNFYIYDNPAALKKYLGDRFDHRGLAGFPSTDFEDVFGLMYSVYAFPNVILPFFGGAIVDRVGTRRSLLVLGIAITLAQCIFAAGVWCKSIWLTLIGRVVYGLAGETFTVAQNVILAEWYAGRELAFSFGITLSFCRGGSVLNNYFSPFLAEKLGLNFSVCFGAAVCAACVVCIFILAPYEIATARALKTLNAHYLGDCLLDDDEGDAADAADDAADEDRFLNSIAKEEKESGAVASATAAAAARNTASYDNYFPLASGSTASVSHESSLSGRRSGENSLSGRRRGGSGGHAPLDGDVTFLSAARSYSTGERSYSIVSDGSDGKSSQHKHKRSGSAAVHPANAARSSADEATDAPSSCVDFRSPHEPRCGRYKCYGVVFWLMVGSTVCGYGVVQTFQNTASSMLLERNLFTAALPVEECCCWSEKRCYASWPDATHPLNGSAIVVPTASERLKCEAGCDFGNVNRAPTLNLTAAQVIHLSCDNDATFPFGLVGDARLGYGIPVIHGGRSNEYLSKFCTAEKESLNTAGLYMSIPYYVNIAFSPFLGILTDRWGKSGMILFLTPLLFVGAHMLLGAVLTLTPIVPLLMQGLGYAFYAAALWAPVAYVVPAGKVGTAYGIMTSALNCGTAVFPLISAAIFRASDSLYIPNTEYFFALLAVCAAIIGAALNLIDMRTGNELNRSHWFDTVDDEEEGADGDNATSK